MSFFQWNKMIKKIFRKKASLRADMHSLEDYVGKKISGNALLRGSMTVEAALIMPIFLFAILNMLSIVDIIRLQTNLQGAMCETVREMAVYGYTYDKSLDGKEGSLAASILGVEAAKLKVIQNAGRQYLNHSMIKGGSGGIWYIRSDVMRDDDLIDLVGRYRVTPLFQIAAWNDIFMINRCRVHAWNGYDNRQFIQIDGKEKIVYVTENGTVYHTSPTCTHLELSINAVVREQVDKERNESGGKYYPCEKCGNKKAGDMFYITNTGDRYHTSLGCSGLKRTIRAIPISEVEGLRVCERCGG